MTGGLLTGGYGGDERRHDRRLYPSQNKLWSNGGTIATGSVVNSSNPGRVPDRFGAVRLRHVGACRRHLDGPRARDRFSAQGRSTTPSTRCTRRALSAPAQRCMTTAVSRWTAAGCSASTRSRVLAQLLEDGDKLLLEDGRGIALYGLKIQPGHGDGQPDGGRRSHSRGHLTRARDVSPARWRPASSRRHNQRRIAGGVSPSPATTSSAGRSPAWYSRAAR